MSIDRNKTEFRQKFDRNQRPKLEMSYSWLVRIQTEFRPNQYRFAYYRDKTKSIGTQTELRQKLGRVKLRIKTKFR